MYRVVASLALSFALAISAHAEGMSRLQPPPEPAPQKADGSPDTMTEAAIIALIIAGSIALYKASGKPCACPSDMAKNGSSCGGRSAWSKPGGAKPLCVPTDVSAIMIAAYRKTKTIPSPW